MNLQDTGFSLIWIVGGWMGLMLVLSFVVKKAPWYKIKSDKVAQHVFFGFSVLLFLVWQLSATLENGLNFHFLLVTTATLMFGWQFSMMAGLIALIGVTVVGGAGWQVLGLNWLVLSVVPSVVVWWMIRWSYISLDRNFFVFVFFNGFLASAISTLIVLILSVLIFLEADIHSFEVLKQSFIQYIPMLVVPEGFVNGVLVAGLILLKPEWLSCFSDEAFLKGK